MAAAQGGSNQYWVPDDTEVFVPCVYDREQFTAVEGGRRHQLTPGTTLYDLGHVLAEQLRGIDRLDELDECNAAAILYAMKVRYQRNVIYTSVRQMIIAVNPFVKLPCCEPEFMKQYLAAEYSYDVSKTSGKKLEPSVYSVGLDAICGLRYAHRGKNRPQAVLISGESGAGKTECAKMCMEFVTRKIQADDVKAAGGRRNSLSHPSIQDQIMKTNPILEAFGNAKTPRNNNSSRFGKWVQMMVSRKEGIQGCTITDYVLELSRVSFQSPEDRNYHIFFQLLEGKKAGNPLLQELDVLEAKDYMYLNKGSFQAQGIRDSDDFQDLKKAFDVLQISEGSQREIFRVTMGILSLGNLEFETDPGSDLEAARLTDDRAAQRVADLFGVELEAVRSSMLQFTTKAGTETITKERKTEDASSTRDALARAIYGRLFKWLIAQCNKLLDTGSGAVNFFGVLDIAGFESFAENSLEQLLINLTNELLQGVFNQNFFELEKKEYEENDIVVDVTYQDNSDIISLIRDKGGILDLLDDSVKTTSATDATFHANAKNKFSDHERMAWPKIASLEFTVKHFAGPVKYTAKGWKEKDSDRPPESASDLLCGSSVKLLREVGADMATQLEAAQSANGAKKLQTLNTNFQASLRDLMDKLNEAEPHFIRCIKPNHAKEPGMFESRLAYEQMTNSGVVEAMRIRQMGFPVRECFEDFVTKYSPIIPEADLFKIQVGEPEDQARHLVEAFVKAGWITQTQVQVGREKVFAKLEGTQKLDESLIVVLKQRLREAMERQDMEELQKQIGEAMGLRMEETDPDLKAARKTINIFEAKQALVAAAQAYEEEAMKQAIQEAHSLDMDCEELTECEAKLAQWEKLRDLRDKLSRTLQSKGAKPRADFIADLTSALEVGRRDGLGELDCQEASRVLEAEQLRLKANQQVGAAEASRSVSQLREAIQEGKACELDPSELQEAERLLDELDKFVKIRAKLDEVLRSTDSVEELHRAVEEAQAEGLPEADLEDARKLLREREAVLMARKALKEAMEHCKLAPLEKALQAARSAGLPEDELADAKEALRKERAKADAKKKLTSAKARGSVAGMRSALKDANDLGLAQDDPEALRECREALDRQVRREAAVRSIADAIGEADSEKRRSVEQLQALLREALDAGILPESEDIEQLNGLIAVEQKRQAIRDQLAAAVESRNTSELKSLILKGKEMGLLESDLEAARRVVGEESRRDLAKEGIAQAMQLRTLKAMEDAISEGEAAGLTDDELGEARSALEQERQRNAVRKELAEAVRSRGVAELSAAIDRGKQWGLRPNELREAEKVFAAEHSKEETRTRLKAAVKARPMDVQELIEALKEAEDVGLTPAECRGPRKLLEQELRKVAARKGIEEAIIVCQGPVDIADENAHASRMQRLERAIKMGQQANLDQAELGPVTDLLQAETLKEEARRELADAARRRDIPSLQEAVDKAQQAGVSQNETEAARALLSAEKAKVEADSKLRKAVLSDDSGMIRAAIVDGVKAGLEERDLEKARMAHKASQRREHARVGLQEATASGKLSALQNAIDEAIASELSAQEIADARTAMRQEESKKAARDRLEQACHVGNLEVLQAALQNAEESGLDSREMRNAQTMHAEVLRRERAREGLHRALASCEAEAVKAALVEAGSVGMHAEDMAPARKFLEDESRKVVARNRLMEAVKSQGLDGVQSAITEAKAAGLEEFELHDARRALKAEERRAAAKKQLLDACFEGGVQALKAAISEGEVAGLDAADLTIARERLREEERKALARSALEMAVTSKSAEQLREAIEQARDASLNPAEMQTARTALKEEERKLAAHASLEDAIRKGEVGAIRAAYSQAEAANVDPRLLTKGDVAIKQEEHRAEARAQLRQATLGSAAPERRAEALHRALQAGRGAGLSEDELQGAQKMLEEEERRARAKAWLEDALQPQRKMAHMLPDVLNECEAAGLKAPELVLAHRVVAARSALAEATKQGHAFDLRKAIADCEVPDIAPFRDEELPLARRLLQERQRQEAAGDALASLMALQRPNLEELQAAVVEGTAAGLDAHELLKARQTLDSERRLQLARERLVEAGRDVRGLQAAIEAGRAAGLSELELQDAQRTLAEEERKQAARLELRLAMESRNVLDLKAAVVEAEGAGLSQREVGEASAMLVGEQQLAARERLAQAVRSNDTDELMDAIGEAKECQIEEHELDGVRATLEGLVEDNFSRVKDSLLSAAGELAFEVAGRQLRTPGRTGLDRKWTEAPLVLDRGTGERLARVVEQFWQRKPNGILDELKQNLRGCATKFGKAHHVEAVSNKHLLRLCFELKSRYGGRVSGHVRQLPLLMLCGLLVTQQDVDTDRMLLFPDCPAAGSGTPPHERRHAYKAYRDRIKDIWVVKEGRAERNATLSGEIGKALRMVLESSLSTSGQALLSKWVKVLCVLCAARDQLSWRQGDSVSAALVGLPRDALQLLQSKKPGDTLVWAGPLSTTTDHSISEQQLQGAGAGAAHLVIEGLTEGLDLSPLSQYPEEAEVLLPPFSLLYVKDVIKHTDQPLQIVCEFQCTLLGRQLQEAAQADLQRASAEMLQALATQAEAASVCPEHAEEPSAGSPEPWRAPSGGYPGSPSGQGDAKRCSSLGGGRRPSQVPVPGLGRSGISQRQGSARGKQPTTQASLRPPVAFGRSAVSPASTPGPSARRMPSSPSSVRSPASPSSKLKPSASAKPRGGRYTAEDFRSLYGVFEAMDRRGVCAVSREDFMWAKTVFERSVDFQRVARKDTVAEHFFQSPEDLTLHRYFCLAMPGATELDIDRMCRRAVMTLRGHGVLGSMQKAAGGATRQVGLRVVPLA